MCKRTLWLIFSLLPLMLLNADVMAQETSTFESNIKLSYSLFEEEGKRTTTQDSYNLYSGFALGSLGFGANFNSGSSLNFASSNLNRGNRDLLLDFRRNNWLDFKLSHQESRFFFGDSQTDSKRKSSSGSLRVSPLKSLKLFLDYSNQKKEGERLGLSPATPGVLGSRYDQFLQKGQIGFQLNAKRSFMSYSFRILDFDSRLDEAFDRRSNRHQVSFSSSALKNILLSGQYLRDDAQLTESDLELNTDLYTLALMYRIWQGLSLTGKLFYQSTDNQATGLTSKTFKNAYNVVYEINRRIGLESGYEYERRKDANGRNNLNSFLIGARALPLDNLKLKANYARKERKDKDLTTLVGPYDSDNFLVNLNYKPIQKLVIDLKYQDRQKENEEILTSTDSKEFTSFASLVYNDKLSVDATFSMQDIEYQDTFGRFLNKTRNLLVNGALQPWKPLKLWSGVNFLDVGGDLDIRREDFNFGVEYTLAHDYSLEFKYDVFNYDDNLQAFDFYTLNVYTISFAKKFGGF